MELTMTTDPRETLEELAEYMGISAGIETMPISDLLGMMKDRWAETCAELKEAEAIADTESEYALGENGNDYWSLEWDRKTQQYRVIHSVFLSNHYASDEIAQKYCDKINDKKKK